MGREWRKVSSVKHARIWPRLKKITRKLALRRLRVKEKRKAMVTSSEQASAVMNLPESIAVLTMPMAIRMHFPIQVARGICDQLALAAFCLMYLHGRLCWKHPNMTYHDC